MAAVALAIHGVANRDRRGFEAAVTGLAQLADVAAARLRPVFWGDLGPEGPLRSVPGEHDSAVLPAARGAFDAPPPEELVLAAAAMAGAAAEELKVKAGRVPADTEALLHEATQQAAAAGYSLALAAEVAPLLADVVLTAEPAGTTEVASGAFGVDRVKDRLVGVLERIDDILVDLLVRTFRQAEVGLGGTVAHTLGDVFAYQSKGPLIRGRLDDAYRDALEASGGGPVDVVAHSLGALVAVEWLMGASVDGTADHPTSLDERQVRHLVTFGTQVSLFSELQGLRRTGDGFGAGPGRQSLAIQVASWTNVWQELDPLAFVIHRVLDVSGTGGATMAVDDRRLTQERIPTDLSFHSSYWRDPRFARWLATRLRD